MESNFKKGTNILQQPPVIPPKVVVDSRTQTVTTEPDKKGPQKTEGTADAKKDAKSGKPDETGPEWGPFGKQEVPKQKPWVFEGEARYPPNFYTAEHLSRTNH
ncbi:unnamed protein product [Gongylonema pulchrum]|uniref:CHZ domain-containing protein n=1 Tax=Gongylonema pulchrum TaxID=637853 RepID=A0A183D5X0_9BILA|nr:unnamed protein product [Gongylonema pulchrum]